jgi:hypothetical protein
MKLSPTVTLALALTAGMAGSAAAQTLAPPDATAPPQATAPTQPNYQQAQTAPPLQSTWQNGASHPSFVQPQAGYAPMQPAYNQPTNGPLPTNYGQRPATYGQAQPNGQMPPTFGRAQPPMNSAMNNAVNSPMGNDRVRQAQAQLQAAGLYKGPVDGMMDPDTRAALGRFQEQNGLRRTDGLDQQTASRLSSQATGYGSSTGAMPRPNADMSSPSTAPIGAGGNTGQPNIR